MRVIIPMTGNGSRFKNDGYSKLKPFIRIHNKPMIHWVCKMFPNEKIELILRQHHIKKHQYIMRDIKNYCKNVTLHIVKSWKKLGPVNDVYQLIKNDDNLLEPILISYCDFYAQWDITKFKKLITKDKPDGIIPCYTGFHPHLLHPENLYATCKSDAKFNLIEIREKHQTNKNKFNDLTSPGLYYFRTTEICKKYCVELMKTGKTINNEYYMSLPFNYMVKDKLKVFTPPIVEYFCQWGTPQDLKEYEFWNTKSFIGNR